MPTKRLYLIFGNSIIAPNTGAFSVTLYSIGILLFGSVFSIHAQLSIGTDIYIDQGAELHIATQETRFHQGMVTAARGSSNGLVSFAPQSTWTLADHNSHDGNALCLKPKTAIKTIGTGFIQIVKIPYLMDPTPTLLI